MTFESKRRQGIAKLIVLASIVGASVGLVGKAWAVDLGGQVGLGAGLTVGETLRDAGPSKRDSYGIGIDISGRFWAGPALLGATAVMLPRLVSGTSERVAVGGAGGQFPLGSGWRIMSMLELGAHSFNGLGKYFLSDSGQGGGSATLPCWGARLELEERAVRPAAATPGFSLGFSLFFLADLTTREQDVSINGIGGAQERNHVGGKLVGVTVRALFGS